MLLDGICLIRVDLFESKMDYFSEGVTRLYPNSTRRKSVGEALERSEDVELCHQTIIFNETFIQKVPNMKSMTDKVRVLGPRTSHDLKFSLGYFFDEMKVFLYREF